MDLRGKTDSLLSAATETVRNDLEKHPGKTVAQLVYLLVLRRPRILFMLSCTEVAFRKGDKIIHFHTCEILVV